MISNVVHSNCYWHFQNTIQISFILLNKYKNETHYCVFGVRHNQALVSADNAFVRLGNDGVEILQKFIFIPHTFTSCTLLVPEATHIGHGTSALCAAAPTTTTILLKQLSVHSYCKTGQGGWMHLLHYTTHIKIHSTKPQWGCALNADHAHA